MSFLAVFAPILAAAVIGGASAGALGVLVVGLRMPFLAVCTAHAALAGAVFGRLVGLPQGVAAFAGALSAAVGLGALLRHRDLDPSAALGTLVSLSLGLAFLGIGLTPGPRAPLLSLLWGSLLLVGWRELAWMALAALALLLLLLFGGVRLKLLLFSRQLAEALIPEPLLLAVVLATAAAVIAVNLETVGGLMLYALVCNPAIAAMRLARSYPATLALAAGLGAACAVGGFLAAYGLDLPVGACIVLVSSSAVGLALARGR